MHKNNKKTTYRRANLFFIFLFSLFFCLFAVFGVENAKADLPGLPATQPWVNIGVCTDTNASNVVDLSNPSQPVIRWNPSGNPQTSYRVIVDDDLSFGSPAVDATGGVETSLIISPGMIDLSKTTYYYSVAISGSSGWTPWASGQFTLPRIDGQCATGLEYCAGTTLTSTTHELCPNGSMVANIVGNSDGPWTWDCKAIGGGIDQNGCQAGIKAPVSGCATISQPCSSVDPLPTAGLCNSLSQLMVAPSKSGNNWNWSCKDACGGSGSCQVAISPTIIPFCGIDSGKAFCKAGEKPSNLCSSGQSSALPGSVGRYEDWKWTCSGSCPNTTVDCSAKSQGSCGWIETN